MSNIRDDSVRNLTLKCADKIHRMNRPRGLKGFYCVNGGALTCYSMVTQWLQ